ncbi:MAG TPA: HRDC domain-containing protein [Candidatus Saccharimonadales bacterium]|nr:HRDC domain-containing protein [Candidatus Saccharimonadales bacterium]
MRQLQALNIMMSGKSVFLTGAPGAGKTYVLNEFIRRATRAGKNVAVTASTGIAATHIGGTTIHSWSGLGIKDSLSEWDIDRLRATDRLVKRYNSTDVLVIDEVSMLHGRRLDMVNAVCKLLRETDKPFGGLQVILVGDLFQLPPINRGGEALDFVHYSAAWQELDPKICYLTEQHRQVHDGLLDMLEAMRRNEVNELHEAMLQERLAKKPNADIAVTRLYSHNIDVEAINQRHLKAIDRDTKVYEMSSSGSSSKIEQLTKSILAPAKLELKIGAEVMFVANDFKAGFVNGTRGRVVDFVHNWPLVQLLNGREITVEPHSWTLEEDGRKRAEIAQLPLRLAWAITIHKSQGMSLDAAEIDLSRSFTPGMGYVALSRVRSIDGVFLAGINQMALAMHPQIFEFDAALRTASEALANITGDYEAPAEPAVVPAIDMDKALFEKLKTWRLARASSDGMPAYIVAHNAVLEELARRPPESLQALKGVKGFGPKKIETYGSDIIEVIAKHRAENR